MSTEFVNRLKPILQESGNYLGVDLPKEESKIVVADVIAAKYLKVESEINRGIFDYMTASADEIYIADKIYADRARIKADISLQKANEKLLGKYRENSSRAEVNRKIGSDLFKRRVPFFITSESWAKNFDKVQLKVGKYEFVFTGDKVDKVINYRKALPVVGKAEGKEFVIRKIHRSTTDKGDEALVVTIDLNQNIIPLLLVGGAVGSLLLGGTGFVLHKAQKVLSAPLPIIVAIGLFLLIVFGKFKV